MVGFLHLPPLGYLNNRYKDSSKLLVYQDEKRFYIIKKLWHLLLEKHYSLNQLKKIADDMGLRTRTGHKLAKSQFY